MVFALRVPPTIAVVSSVHLVLPTRFSVSRACRQEDGIGCDAFHFPFMTLSWHLF